MWVCVFFINTFARADASVCVCVFFSDIPRATGIRIHNLEIPNEGNHICGHMSYAKWASIEPDQFRTELSQPLGIVLCVGKEFL